jgi:hypothetical protein
LRHRQDYKLDTPGWPADRRRFDFVMRPWNAQEIREPLSEAGFGSVDVGSGVGHATDDRLFVVARF